MNEEKLIDYIIRYCKHELSDSEYTEFNFWLEKEVNRRKFEDYLKLYKNGRKIGCWKAVDEMEAWNRVVSKVVRVSSKKSVRMKHWWRYVAVIVSILGVGLVYIYRAALETHYEQNQVAAVIAPGERKAVLHLSNGKEVVLENGVDGELIEANGAKITYTGNTSLRYKFDKAECQEVVYNKIVVPRGGEYSLVLADGSEVWLNAESELIYPVVFKGAERKVTLKGEAFFKVVKDTEHPFIVQSDYNRIEVIGTQFNVSTYNEKCIKTTLLEGAVKVSNNQDSCFLQPGEQAVCSSCSMVVQAVDASIAIAWLQGVFEFENMNLKEITEQLGRWYDVRFVFVNPELEEMIYTGAATRYRDLGFVLNLLEELSDLKFIVEGKVVKVERAKNYT